MNYVSTHSEAIKRYHTSVIILHIHSDTSFLSDTGANSRAGGYHYLSTSAADPNTASLKQPPLNGPGHVKCTTMINFLAIALEEELGALFVNFQRDVAMRIALIEMGHAQPPTPEVTDSSTGDRFVNDNIRQRRSRAIYVKIGSCQVKQSIQVVQAVDTN